MPQLNMNKYDTMQYNTACSVIIIFLFLLHININIWYHHNAYLVLIFCADLCTQAVQVSANKYSKFYQLGGCNLHWKAVTFSPHFISRLIVCHFALLFCHERKQLAEGLH